MLLRAPHIVAAVTYNTNLKNRGNFRAIKVVVVSTIKNHLFVYYYNIYKRKEGNWFCTLRDVKWNIVNCIKNMQFQNVTARIVRIYRLNTYLKNALFRICGEGVKVMV